MKNLKSLTGCVFILLSSYAFTATAHEGKEHNEVHSEAVNEDVPALEWDGADYKKAEKLFRSAGGYGCVACHSQFAQGGGNVGGNIRDHSLGQINYALQNEPTMKLLNNALSPDDKKLLASYLKTLGQFKLVEWTIDGDSSYSKTSLDKGSASQLVISNKTFEPLTLSLEPLGNGGEITVEPYETKSYEWTTEPGVVRLQYRQNILDIDVR
ncbi:hypothetical protein DI392_16845 [Vibrio albus]|uniref:Cytochrome c domain-containing protein n=1 Tax=Vibrio albus TaxID=2200953 RepID=A0A2U3B6B0_9VIBR|nr:hypothetical protein [Vibrio albus]PWI32336.1 hypothetical protein DI392_16845 [Vibrio albus]